MLNFTFHNPTKIVFGAGTLAKLSALIPETARVLMLYGGNSAERNGTLAEVRAALAGRHCGEFGGIEPNPTYETLMRAVARVQDEQFDFLLAVGGGSVIDGCKFVAAAACFSGDPWEILLKFGRNIESALPFGSVLTLPATGSEMNHGAVVTRHASRTKLPFQNTLVYPRFSILDPTRTYSLPARQLANGIADAFTHIIEQYLTYPAGGTVQDRLAEGLLQTLIDIAPQVLATPDDYDARANLMWTASLALNGLIGAGVPQDWSTHMIGHELTALYDIDHARTLAIVLPANLKVRRAAKAAKLLQYAERVWKITTGSDEQRIDAAIARTSEFLSSLGMPTRLADCDLGSAAVDAVLEQLESHGMTRLGENRDVDPELCRKILEAAL